MSISVIIPAYNAEKYIQEAIQSIFNQTVKPLEIIVVNDGSTDQTHHSLKVYGNNILYFEQKNSGPASARNHGIRKAQGDFLAFLDADDLWTPNKLELQMNGINSYDMVFGGVEHFYSPELSEESKRKIYCPTDILHGPLPGNFLIKKETFERIGYFSEEYKVGEFIEWMIRAKDLKSKTLSEVILRRRIHENNLGRKEQKNRTDYAKILMRKRKHAIGR